MRLWPAVAQVAHPTEMLAMVAGQGVNVSSVKLVSPDELTHRHVNTHRGPPTDLGYHTSLLKGQGEITSQPLLSIWCATTIHALGLQWHGQPSDESYTITTLWLPICRGWCAICLDHKHSETRDVC